MRLSLAALLFPLRAACVGKPQGQDELLSAQAIFCGYRGRDHFLREATGGLCRLCRETFIRAGPGVGALFSARHLPVIRHPIGLRLYRNPKLALCSVGIEFVLCLGLEI